MPIKYLNNETKNFFETENYLYRVLELDRFIAFKKNNFTFISPTRWSDPYEKAFLETKYIYGGKIYKYPLKEYNSNKLFAQCWTASKQLEAMWKVFAPNHDGVMIKMSVRSILKILENISQRNSYDFYIGKVIYEDAQSMYQMKGQEFIWREISQQLITKDVISLMLKKRMPFKFENEFRIMAVKRNGSTNRTVLNFKYEHILGEVEYLKFDPRMGKNLFSLIKENIQIDYPILNVHRSALYSKPTQTITFNGPLPREINDEIIFN